MLAAKPPIEVLKTLINSKVPHLKLKKYILLVHNWQDERVYVCIYLSVCMCVCVCEGGIVTEKPEIQWMSVLLRLCGYIYSLTFLSTKLKYLLYNIHGRRELC